MSAAMPTRDGVLDRLCEFANVGAGHAAGALATFLGRAVTMRVPKLVSADEFDADAAVLFAVEGGIGGHFAVGFWEAPGAALLQALLGAETTLASGEAAAALGEVGNVLASHALSAVADLTGTRLVPSVPSWIGDDVRAALAGIADGRSIAIENTLVDEAGTPLCALLWVPARVEHSS